MVERLRARLEADGRAVDGGGTSAAAATGATAPPTTGRRRRVSCISPTTPERHLFHERALYRCIRKGIVRAAPDMASSSRGDIVPGDIMEELYTIDVEGTRRLSF